MFESIKTQLWEFLKEKEVSLVMIFNQNGDILWNKGRPIEGKSIHLGSGFSKSFAKKVIAQGGAIEKDDVDIMVFGNQLSESAQNLSVKSLLILPMAQGFFLYVDSGTREYFTQSDRDVFRVLGQLLENTIERVKTGGDSGGIAGVSPAMNRIRQMVITYALEEEPVLLLGETGVGKSHIAELIHRFSGRSGDFVAAEITSINENLFESTMFGHKKGAFTDARADKKGLVQEADKGTLFIDEISEIPTSFQAKLLRFIEKKKYRVMGDPREQTADVRIVAASNKNLEKAIADKEFREDLYYRLHVLEIEIPPLRERKEDIRAFFKRNRNYLKDKDIGDGFWEAILDYHWPGNMRELITVLKRAGILLDSPITGDKINKMIHGNMHKTLSSPTPAPEPWKQKIVENLGKGISFWETVKGPFLERDLNRGQVKTVIAEALEKTGGNYKETLKLLNVDDADYVKFMKFLYRNRLN